MEKSDLSLSLQPGLISKESNQATNRISSQEDSHPHGEQQQQFADGGGLRTMDADQIVRPIVSTQARILHAKLITIMNDYTQAKRKARILLSAVSIPS